MGVMVRCSKTFVHTETVGLYSEFPHRSNLPIRPKMGVDFKQQCEMIDQVCCTVMDMKIQVITVLWVWCGF